MTKFQKFLFIVIIQCSLILSAAEEITCPLGKNEDHLTIQRVMMNYGKFVSDADHVAVFGARYPHEDLTDQDIQKAISQLDLAINCAQAILNNPTGDLLPNKAHDLHGAEQEEYISDFLSFTEDFRDALIAYQLSFKKILIEEITNRNWEPIYQESVDLNEMISHAHRKLSNNDLKILNLKILETVPADTTPAPSLKANMKQIKKSLNDISKNLNDATFQQANVDLSLLTQQLFTACLNQIPKELNDLPAEQKSLAVQDYQKMIGLGLELSQKLTQALQNSDIAQATDLLQKLNQLKQDGHQRYNP